MKVKDTPENKAKCICPDCPTYNECMQKGKEKFFCAKGKTSCDVEKQGCICPECPIYAEFALKDLYYCKNGEAE